MSLSYAIGGIGTQPVALEFAQPRIRDLWLPVMQEVAIESGTAEVLTIAVAEKPVHRAVIDD
jgi:hypothetical protein